MLKIIMILLNNYMINNNDLFVDIKLFFYIKIYIDII